MNSISFHQADEQVGRAVEEIWRTTLGLAIAPANSSGAGRPIPEGLVLTGCIQIGGDWQGAVSIECTRPLAYLAAAIMFGVEPAEATRDQVQDALGELTNILAGRFKKLLPRSCRLSLPAVLEGLDRPFQGGGDRVVARLAFTCDAEPLMVTILEGTR